MIIKIKNLRLKTILGIYEWEQKAPRDIVINAIIHTDNNASMLSDDIEDTIDYDNIVNAIKELVTKNKFGLIEKMVGDVMDLIMQDQRINRCELEIDKIGAVENVDSFSITDIRNRK
ncbi:MAG: dihydroneopterin aldolase [Proteobacteria bacterium]|nr:dihydroneopterin aldolase [Pseudomonadota bacterium]